MRRMKMMALGGLAAFALHVMAAATPAAAHPHVFVKVKTQLIAKDGALIAIRHTWSFDETWLENQLLEHDKDGDGKLSRAELAPLEEESKATLEMFRSFTLVRTGGALIRVVNPRDVLIDYQGPVLGLSFTATLAKPVPLQGSDILLETYDATFFSSFTFDGDDAVTFVGDRPAGCTVKAGVPGSPQQMHAYRMVKKQMGPEWVDKGGVPRSTSIVCEKGAVAGVGEATGARVPVTAAR